MFQSERELFPPKQSARMADGEDLSVLKRRIVAVDKLVRSQQKVESRNAEILLSLEGKEKELDEAKIAKEELEKRSKEVVELKARLAEAESGKNQHNFLNPYFCYYSIVKYSFFRIF